jgi:hypothetical protein
MINFTLLVLYREKDCWSEHNEREEFVNKRRRNMRKRRRREGIRNWR